MQPELLVAQALPVAVSLPRQQPPTSTTGRDRLADTLATYDPWFSQDVGKYDKELLPHHLAERLLRDSTLEPLERPRSMVNAAGPCTLEQHTGCDLSRSQRVFRSTLPRARHSARIDVWHNAGGKRSRKPLPSPENVRLWRQYGAVEAPITRNDGTVQHIALFNYHEYRLAEQSQIPRKDASGERGSIPVLYHVFRIKRNLGNEEATVAAVATAAVAPTRLPVKTNSHSVAAMAAAPAPSDSIPLRIQAPPSASTSVFISFRSAMRQIGQFSTADGFNGLKLQSAGGDVAEWHQVADAESNLCEGDIVAIGCDARITRLDAARAKVLGVVTRKAIVEGSAAPGATVSTDAASSRIEPSRPEFDTVAYCGRVPVRVRGTIRAGDCITPSGLDDGTGVSASDVGQPIVGRVLTLGEQPAIPSSPWFVEIAVTPPGASSYRSGSRRLATVLSVILCLILAFCARISFFDGVPTQPSVSTAPPVAVCGPGGFNHLKAVCAGDASAFYGDKNLEPREMLKRALGTGMARLNLGAVGMQMGRDVAMTGVCDSTRLHSRCYAALRHYLDRCPMTPGMPGENPIVADGEDGRTGKNATRLAQRANVSTTQWMRDWAQIRTPGALDILFLRQCFAAAAPDLVSPASLIARRTSMSDYSPTHADSEDIPAQQTCHNAADILSEACAACSKAECTPSAWMNAHPPETCSLGANLSGCGCTCYAVGSECAQMIRNTLKVARGRCHETVRATDCLGM